MSLLGLFFSYFALAHCVCNLMVQYAGMKSRTERRSIQGREVHAAQKMLCGEWVDRTYIYLQILGLVEGALLLATVRMASSSAGTWAERLAERLASKWNSQMLCSRYMPCNERCCRVRMRPCHCMYISTRSVASPRQKFIYCCGAKEGNPHIG